MFYSINRTRRVGILAAMTTVALLSLGCHPQEDSSAETIHLENGQNFIFPRDFVSCAWIQTQFHWTCFITMDRGRDEASSRYLPHASFSGNYYFDIADESVQKIQDLVGHTYTGEGSITVQTSRSTGLSWSPHSLVRINVQSFNPQKKTLLIALEGSTDYVTFQHPDGELRKIQNTRIQPVLSTRSRPIENIPAPRMLAMEPAPFVPYEHLSSLQTLAEKGDLKAEYLLGHVYISGIFGKRDWDHAFLWWQRAAERGYPEAQDYYALKFHDDPVQTYMWAELASRGGVAQARRSTQQLRKKMTRDQLTQATELADHWKPKDSKN